MKTMLKILRNNARRQEEEHRLRIEIDKILLPKLKKRTNDEDR